MQIELTREQVKMILNWAGATDKEYGLRPEEESLRNVLRAAHDGDVTSILDRLDAYTGDDIWRDIILNLTGYDHDATTSNGRPLGDSFFLTSGVLIQYNAQRGNWYQQ